MSAEYREGKNREGNPVPNTVTEVRAKIRELTEAGLLRLSTAGSVDDGKSTLIGRLLHDSKNIFEDHLRAIERKSKGKGGALELAYLTDGLRAEQEQGITIDVAYRYFSTPKRRFILADTPGHEQYTRNMATGASTADLTIILVDARNGVNTQTKRHSFIAALLGVPRLLVAVNKMDLVDFDEQVFERIRADYIQFAGRLGVKDVRFIPVAALHGDNVVHRSESMPWYHGETVMEYLENVYTAGDDNQIDFRFPVQLVIRPNQDFRGYAGQVASGRVHVGEEVVALPSRRTTVVESILLHGKPIQEVQAGEAVVVTLRDKVDLARGDMIVRARNIPQILTQFEAMVVWMGTEPMDLAKQYIVMHTTRESKIVIESVQYKVDVNTLHRSGGGALALNEIGRLSLTSKNELFLDPYTKNRGTGNFIVVDPESFLTVGAGLVLDRIPASYRDDAALLKASDLHAEASLIAPAERTARSGKASTVWFTGLSGSGKSTLARLLERQVFDAGRNVYHLDGDNLRTGLNKGLGFSRRDREENIRRAAEVAKILNDAGVTVICSFISPFREDRARAREIVGTDRFMEVFVDAPLDLCEVRDPHGLYRKARSGEIAEFTGVSAPYEAPEAAEITVSTQNVTPETCVEEILSRLLTVWK